jgi:hypothetical protein
MEDFYRKLEDCLNGVTLNQQSSQVTWISTSTNMTRAQFLEHIHESDFNTHEYDFYTYECDLNTHVHMYACDFEYEREFDTHVHMYACDFEYEREFDTH